MMDLPYKDILELRSLKDDLNSRNIISNIVYHIQSKSMCNLLKKSKRYVNVIRKEDFCNFAQFAINIEDNRVEVRSVADAFMIKFKKEKEMVIIETTPFDDLMHITDKRDIERDMSFSKQKINSSKDIGEFCYNIMIDIIVDYLRGR